MAEDAFEVQITDSIKSLLLDSKSKVWISATELTAEDNHANRQNKELKNLNSISFLILPIPNSIYAFFFSFLSSWESKLFTLINWFQGRDCFLIWPILECFLSEMGVCWSKQQTANVVLIYASFSSANLRGKPFLLEVMRQNPLTGKDIFSPN